MLTRALGFLVVAGICSLALPASAHDPDAEEDDGRWIDPPAADEQPSEPADPDGEQTSAAPGSKVEVAPPEPAETEDVETSEALEVEEVEAVRVKPKVPLPAHYLSRRRKYLRPIPGAEPPEGYVWGERNKHGLWRGGIGLSAGTYALSVITTGLTSIGVDNRDVLLYGSFPLIGPFIAASIDDEIPGGMKAVFAVEGLGQLAGLAMIIGGVSMRVPTWKRDRRYAGATVDVEIQPTGAGLNVTF
ncbi:MAG: hypothetical protein HOW73_31415 [Polyangiaceae bacterium]|nr:hypothetical protein [Polyangiaceae bacterium]